jgi:tetratricopeptide (TPR) repeat protein
MFNSFFNDFNFKVIISSFLLLYLFITPKNFPSSPTDKEIEDMVVKGLDRSYNFKWNEAEQIFTKIENQFPGDPRGYHFEASVYLWYYLSSKEDSEYDNFLHYSDLTIEKGNKLLEKEPDNKDLLYIIGTDYTFRAIVFSKAGHYLDAAWATKKSESYLIRVLEIDSTYYDAYLGLGLYNFAIGQIPSAFKWVLSLAGIDGDKTIGIKYITKCAKNGYLSKIDAQYYLSQILSEVLFDYDSASLYLKSLIQKYPNNLIFNYSYASLEIKRHHLDQAQKVLEKIVTVDTSKFIQLISLSNFLLGDILYKKNDFNLAINFYQNFLKQTRDNDYTGIASYRLGVSYEISGDTVSAKKYFEQSGNGNMDLDDDIYAKRKGEIYFNRDIDSNEVKVIAAANKIDAGRYQSAYNDLYKLIPVIKDEDLKAEVYLYLSSASFWLNNYDESLKMGFAAQSINAKEEKWIKPFAVYYIARAYKKMGNMVAYKNFIAEAGSYEDYDYQNKLRNLIYSIKLKD